MKKQIRLLLALLCCVGCAGPSDSPLEEALKLSGSNRPELEKVLEHYGQDPKDSLKLCAARFLIENMRWHHSLLFKDFHTYHQRINTLFSAVPCDLPDVSAGLDSILSQTNRKTTKKLQDLNKVSSAFLIANIEQAFETRKYPWCENLSFPDFCEYVLPYRVEQSPLEEWRPAYQEAYSRQVDSLMTNGATDSSVCAFFMSSYIYANYTNSKYKPPHLPTNLLKLKLGDCVDFSQAGAYLARTFGLPVTIDLTPQWANGHGKHQWDALLSGKGSNIPYMTGDFPPFGTHLRRAALFSNRKLAKVYRRTFSANPEFLELQTTDEQIPPTFRNPCFKDVSGLYFEPADLPVDLEIKAPEKKKFVYIMVFDNQVWRPVHWARIKGRKAVFTDMARNCAYMAMYYHNKKYHPASYPFTVDGTGSIRKLIPDTDRRTQAVLTRKYHSEHVRFRIRNVIGDRIQGANTPDFRDADDLYVIRTVPEANYQTISVHPDKKYRYLRYLASTDFPEYEQQFPNFNTKGNIAELEVWNNDQKRITGKTIGTDDSEASPNNGRNNVFDGDPLTYFATPSGADAWVGLAFDKEESIDRIIYLPRNDDNFIHDKEIYELFYWNNRWTSLGRKQGDQTQMLVYENIPDGALLLLKNHTKGKEERIFTYENGKQVWW